MPNTKLSNRQIDALIAEHVMGWFQDKNYWRLDETTPTFKAPTPVVSFDSFRPTEDISAAWQVWEKMKDERQVVANKFFYVFRYNLYEINPKAICLAALRAKGVKLD